jgi:tetratricopeptide (TPR) repeat protein
MKGNKAMKAISIFVLFLLPSAFLFSQTDESSKVFENNAMSVIALTSYGKNKEIISEGSGFVVAKGVLLTSYLLVSQAKSMVGRNFSGKKIKVEGVLGVDKDFFIALLKIKGKTPPLTLGNSDELERGKKVIAIGSNEAGTIAGFEGEVKNIHELSSTQKIIEDSLSIPLSFSGGPLLDKNGQVMGMTIFIERRLKFIVPSNVLKSLQQGTLVKFKKWQPEEYLATTEAASIAGKIALKFDETGLAEKYLKRVLMTDPQNIEIHSLLASVYSRQRNYGAAVLSYKKIIELNDKKDEAHLGLGLIYLNMRQYKEAIPSLEKAIQLNSDHAEKYYQIGNAYEELKDYTKAGDSYKRFLDSKPERPWEAYYRLGLCRRELSDYENAITAFQGALKGNPQDVKINQSLAQSFLKAAQYEKAEEIYKFLAQLMPEDATLYYRTILSMYNEVKMHDKAIEAAKKIIEFNPDDADAVYNLGYMYFMLKKYREAIQAFKRVLELRPNFEYAYANIANCYFQIKNYSQALWAYKKLLEIDPENSDNWFNLAVSYMQLKRHNDALASLKKTIELRPDHAVAYYNLAIVYMNLRDSYSARDVYKQLTKIDPAWAKKLRKILR